MRMNCSLAGALGLGLASLLGGARHLDAAPSPLPTEPPAAHSSLSTASYPARVSVAINGTVVLPAPGSNAGIWSYTTSPAGPQLLLTGHATVPGSWRLTASLNAGDVVRLTFSTGTDGDAVTNLNFQSKPLAGASLVCAIEQDTLSVHAPDSPGAVQLSGFTWGNAPASFVPDRRPFSRQPAITSPDPHPTLAEALVEWDWRMQDGIQTPREPRTYRQAIDKLVPRVEALLSERRRLKTLTSEQDSAWRTLLAKLAPADQPTSQDETLWRELHQGRRRLILSNPVFGTSSLLFVKHVPSVMSHQLTQMYGYCARPGGGLFVLNEPGVSMGTRDLTPASLPAGNFMTPELSQDGRKVLFAYCPVQEAPTSWDFNGQNQHLHYHVHELSLESGAVRSLTKGDNDNFSPVSLPSGDILFVSTRRGGFHRCGRGPCFVYTLARMTADGSEPHSISFHETHEWDPCLLNDGRVIYTRWDYVDRNAVHYQQLWSTRPDGGNAQIYYGNNTWNPTGLWEARSIPESAQIMATAAPHHGMSAGSIVRLDTNRGVDGPEPITRLTPDVRFPESEAPLAFGPSAPGYDFDTPVTQYWRSPLVDPSMQKNVPEEESRWPGHCYKSPWPLSEAFFIVSYSFDPLVGEPGPNLPNMFGLYYADAFGNKELVYRDPAISSLWARPLARRSLPPELITSRSTDGDDHGTFLLHDVRESWPYLPGDSDITHLRILQVLLKTTPHADNPRVGAAFAAPGKQVLGTVPVERDGSAFFEVPAKTPVLFQALNARGRAVQTMRSLVYLQPGERQSCVGCHEHRGKTPSAGPSTLAAQRPPSRIQPGPDGSRPFSYPRLVQPVLDRHCVRCHDGKDPKRSVLTGEPEGAFSKSYNALVPMVSFSAWGRPEQNLEPTTSPMRFGAVASPLTRLLDQGHGDVRLPPDDEERLITWMDANALFYGTFDPAEQRQQLAGQTIPGPRE